MSIITYYTGIGLSQISRECYSPLVLRARIISKYVKRRQPPNYIITSDGVCVSARENQTFFSFGFLIFLSGFASTRLDDETSHATDRKSGRVFI